MIMCADNEKEREMKIGNPTDVKHVAHIGYDGPSESSPSWVIIKSLSLLTLKILLPLLIST